MEKRTDILDELRPVYGTTEKGKSDLDELVSVPVTCATQCEAQAYRIALRYFRGALLECANELYDYAGLLPALESEHAINKALKFISMATDGRD